MAVCLNCGKEANGCLCDECRITVNLEDLCRRLVEYQPGCGENPLWDQTAAELSNPNNLRNVVFSLAEALPSPRKEYWQILSFSGTHVNVQKYNRPWLYESYKKISKIGGLSLLEMNRIKGIVLGALFMDYRYEEADLLAGELLEEEKLPVQAYYNLADFWSKTRRYDEADETISMAETLYGKEKVQKLFGDLPEKNRKYREKEAQGKQQYMPNPPENRDEARKAYENYLASIGIEIKIKSASATRRNGPTAIPRDQYPDPKEIRDTDFNTFVAFDLETTGFSPKTDSIIEIGAVKVSGDRIVESKEFTFQEFVHPFKKGIREEITKLTGISKEDVKDARQMWEAFPDFMKFAGNSVLVGFNNVKFDSRFLVRAGRYSNIIMNNPQFDVMKYAENFREKLGIEEKKISLETLGRKLGIENPEAHRALSDAITTARIYLKLKEMDSSNEELGLDDLLSEFDNW